MNTLILTLLLTVHAVPDVRPHCPVGIACYHDGAIYMREAGEFSGTFRASIEIDGIHFPHFDNPDVRPWRKCGVEIAYRADLPIHPKHYNLFHVLCHETSHAAGNEHP